MKAWTAQDALTDFLTGLGCDSWATWTFGPKWEDGPSPDAVRRYCQRWITDWRVVPAYLVAEQGGVGGRWHAHGLLTCGRISRRALWGDWFRQHGRCRFEPLGSDHGRLSVARYVAKYCVKDTDDGISLPMRWWVTDNGVWSPRSPRAFDVRAASVARPFPGWWTAGRDDGDMGDPFP